MDVSIRLLGGFSVVIDGAPVPESAWTRRHAANLVKLLALTRGHRALRDQVLEALWPDGPGAAGPRLHKAAHYARRALGDEESATVLLRGDLVHLLPDAEVRVDAMTFRAAAEAALANGSADEAAQALAGWTGPLLPDDLYESWTADHRDHLDHLHRRLLALAGRWEELTLLDPADEAAHLQLIRNHAAAGDLHAAVRQFERLDRALRRELGTRASAEAEQLRAELRTALPDPFGARTVTGSDPRVSLRAGADGHPGSDLPDSAQATGEDPGARLVGRREAGDTIRRVLAEAEAGRGRTLLVSGPPGVGKSAVLALASSLATRRDWRISRGTASAIEGPWPYSPVLEALSDLCRRHPSLLDGLDDRYRSEIDQALSGHATAWVGESSHQRLFVAAAELVRLAAAGHGLLLVVDDVHEADEASLRLIHYLTRVVASESVVIALGCRPGRPDVERMQASLVSRGLGEVLQISPLNEAATLRLLRLHFPTLDDATARRVRDASGGIPFTALELARTNLGESGPGLMTRLPHDVHRTLCRSALLGMAFTTDEWLSLADAEEAAAYDQLRTALAAAVVVPVETGYQFRHALVRDDLLRTIGPAELAATHREVAARLARLHAAPGRIAHHYLSAGLPGDAVPYVTSAVEIAGALGAYRDALTLVDAVRDHAGPDHVGHLLARRGDLLLAMGDPAAIPAYLEAMPVTSGTEHRTVRARLARAACFAGELDLAASALDGLRLTGDAADGPILLARGNLAYFTGDVEGAWEASSTARRILSPQDPWHVVDLVGLQGLIAHQRGEWFERFRQELRRTRDRPALAAVLFDAHLCVAEYLLYGRLPYVEVIELATDLRTRAERAGALRGAAFATALTGEAALLMGDLERAERELQESIDLHRDLEAAAGEAHSLQRLAEVRLAQGRPDEARTLLQRALPLARWSVVSSHLLQRIYGAMIVSAPSPALARAVVDEAEAALGQTDWCLLCSITLQVPAAIACAQVGDVQEARRHLADAEASAARWDGQAWKAAVLEAHAHVAYALDDAPEGDRLLLTAAEAFTGSGQVLDAERCRRSVHGSRRRPDSPVPAAADPPRGRLTVP